MGKRNIYQKLCYVQSKLKAPKNQYNKFGNYYYRNSEDIQEALKPLMKRVGAILIISDEIVQVGERFYIKATARFIDAETGEIIENTAYAREEAEKKGMDASQITGSTSSYARKYALNGLFCIDDTKDSDALQGQPSGTKEPQKGQQREHQNGRNERKEKTTSTPTQAPASSPSTPPSQAPTPAAKEPSRVVPFPGLEAKYVNKLYLELSRTGVGLQSMLGKYKKKDIHELTVEEYKDAMNILNKKPGKPIETKNSGKKPDKSVESKDLENTPGKPAESEDMFYDFPPDLDETGLPWAAVT